MCQSNGLLFVCHVKVPVIIGGFTINCAHIIKLFDHDKLINAWLSLSINFSLSVASIK